MLNILLTIITPTFNCINKVNKTLESIRFNNVNNLFEHIILDSNSNDGTFQVLTNYKNISINKYPIKLINEKDEGIFDALNKGTNLSNGQFIMVLHAGDELNLNLNEIIEDIKLNLDCDILAYSGYFKSKKLIEWNRKDFKLSLLNPAIRHPTLILKKDLLLNFNGYDLDFPISADYDFIYRILKSNKNIKIKYLNNKFLMILEDFYNSGKLKNFISKKIEHIKITKDHKFNKSKIIFYFKIIKQFIYVIINIFKK